LGDAKDTTQSKTASLPAGSTILGGRFRIEQLLAGGGMGLVYIAEQVSLGRRVAVKVLRTDVPMDGAMAERFKREALLLSSIEHPSVVRVIDFGQEGDAACMVMEYVEGESLEAVLTREGALPPERVERILVDLAHGLSAIHAKGIVHRDLKPDNVVLVKAADGEERARLLDFGIARLAQPDTATNVTQVGMVLGTPEYLSPEQAMGHTLDARSDLYSLGVLAYRMLAGKHPFPGPGPQEFIAQHVHQTPTPLLEAAPQLASLPPLVDLVMACLEKNPAARPAGANAFVERLRPTPLLLTATLSGAMQAQAARMTGAHARKQRGVAVGVALGVVLLMVAAAVAVTLTRPERRARRLIEKSRGTEALQVIDDVGPDGQTPVLRMLKAAALHQAGRHDDEAELMRGLPETVTLERAAVLGLADDYGHAERPALRKLLSALPRQKSLPILQELALKETGWPQWGALRFVDVEYAGQGLSLVTLYAGALSSRDCRIRALAARRLGELRSAEALEPLKKLRDSPKKKPTGEADECGQDAAAAAVTRLEKELNP
jgi:predicted Ser/Thr protein kinase